LKLRESRKNAGTGKYGRQAFPAGKAHIVADRPCPEADRIAADPEILVGKPVISGTGISVEFVVDLLASGWSHWSGS
jgi:hypothetical protein